MRYELICSDFDNTIRSDARGVTDFTLDVIRRFEALGGKFNLITGRMYYSIKDFARKYGFHGLVGTYQGAAVFDLDTDQMVYCVPLCNSLAIEILELIESLGNHSHVYYGEKFYTNHPNRFTDYYVAYTGTDCVYNGIPNSRFLQETGYDPIKIVVFEDADKIHALQDKVRERFGDRVNTTLSQTTFLEIVHKDVSKGACLRFIADYYGVDIAKTMSFGDATNDNALITAAGMGIAVGNAMQETKAVADYVTDNAEDDGVAKAMLRFCF